MTNTLSGLFIKKTFLALVVVIFAFTAVYVPQSHTKVAYAAPAQEVTQAAGFWQQLWDGVMQTSIFNVSVASMVTNGLQWSVTNILNGIAWAAAKSAISAMQRSIVRWINSGFKGSPAFIQDLGGFLTNIADETMGGLLLELGGPFSIVCSPFRLNVQIAISSAYNRTRDRSARRCTLSGALQNIRSFSTDMSQGGWDSWFKISQNPGQYTQFGSVLEAQVEVGVVLANARGEQYRLLDWSSGFLSSRVCTPVIAPDGTRSERCVISTPGAVIASQINETLQLGPRSLVAADQINEVIGAFMQQLLVQAVTGVNGLLGTGGAKGYNAQFTNPSFNTELYTPGMEIQNTTQGRQLISDALATEEQYLSNTTALINRYESSFTDNPSTQQRADRAYNEARNTLPVTRDNTAKLEALLLKYDAAPTESEKLQVLYEYNAIAVNLSQIAAVRAKTDQWNFEVGGMKQKTSTTTLNAALERETLYLDLAQAANRACAGITLPTANEDVACASVRAVIITTQLNINELERLLIDVENLGERTNRTQIENKYTELKPGLSTDSIVATARLDWEAVLGPIAR